MIIFIDESGDPGFKTNKGSSQYFVLSFVIFYKEEDVISTTDRILRYRQSLKISDRYEFKFNNLNKKNRCALLEYIKNCQFAVAALAVKKDSIEKKYRENLNYEYFLGFILEKIVSNDRIYDLRIDGSMRTELKNILKSHLRKYLPPKSKIEIHILDSKNDLLIQLADIVAGSMYKNLTERNDKTVYKNIIKKHIIGEYIL